MATEMIDTRTAADAPDDAMTAAFARRAPSFAISPWDMVVEFWQGHPDPVFFGNGAPAPDVVPKARLQEAAAAVWSDVRNLELGYGGVRGFAPLRELIAERMAAQGIEVAPEGILLTNGSQQGIDLISRLMLDPGDLVVVEGPAYIGALQVFDACEAQYIVVPVDDDGMDVAALEEALRAAPRPPKFLYTVPTFQNPTGVTLSLERRTALLEVAHRHGLLVVEDDPYGELRYEGESLPPLRALDPNVVYLGTFSKTIAPGLRIGWMITPPRFQAPLTNAREVIDIHGDRMTPQIVHRAARDFLDDHLATVARPAYRSRRDALAAALAAEMPPCVTWSVPRGGFFFWLDLPEALSPMALQAPAAAAGAIILPGDLFYPGYTANVPGGRNGIRLSFSSVDEAAIQKGISRLGAIFNEAINGEASR